jgi:hypothetical protein
MTEELPPQQRRESIMQRRLRKARGEEIEDVLEEEPYFDEMGPPVGLRRAYETPLPYQSAGTGCSPGLVTISLTLLGVLTIVFLFGTAFMGIANPLAQLSSRIPGVSAIASPTPTIRSSASVILRMQQLNRLETTSYTVEKVIEAGIEGNAFENLLFGDRLLLIANGTVVAGLDLSLLQPSDITLSEDGKIITIRLPPVQIFSATLDNTNTRVYDREKGLLATTDKDLETIARQTAEAEILQAACEADIMERATTDARRSVEQLLRMLDFERVEIVADPVPACPAYPVNAQEG